MYIYTYTYIYGWGWASNIGGGAPLPKHPATRHPPASRVNPVDSSPNSSTRADSFLLITRPPRAGGLLDSACEAHPSARHAPLADQVNSSIYSWIHAPWTIQYLCVNVCICIHAYIYIIHVAQVRFPSGVPGYVPYAQTWAVSWSGVHGKYSFISFFIPNRWSGEALPFSRTDLRLCVVCDCRRPKVVMCLFLFFPKMPRVLCVSGGLWIVLCVDLARRPSSVVLCLCACVLQLLSCRNHSHVPVSGPSLCL